MVLSIMKLISRIIHFFISYVNRLCLSGLYFCNKISEIINFKRDLFWFIVLEFCFWGCDGTTLMERLHVSLHQLGKEKRMVKGPCITLKAIHLLPEDFQAGSIS